MLYVHFEQCIHSSVHVVLQDNTKMITMMPIYDTVLSDNFENQPGSALRDNN